MEGGNDEFSGDDDGTGNPPNPPTAPKKFQLPKRLRGWLFMERSQIPLKEYSGILNMTKGLNIDQLKKVMIESYPDTTSPPEGGDATHVTDEPRGVHSHRLS